LVKIGKTGRILKILDVGGNLRKYKHCVQIIFEKKFSELEDTFKKRSIAQLSATYNCGSKS